MLATVNRSSLRIDCEENKKSGFNLEVLFSSKTTTSYRSGEMLFRYHQIKVLLENAKKQNNLKALLRRQLLTNDTTYRWSDRQRESDGVIGDGRSTTSYELWLAPVGSNGELRLAMNFGWLELEEIWKFSEGRISRFISQVKKVMLCYFE